MKITLYGKAGDAYTVAFKNFLRMAEVPFEFKDITKDKEARDHTKTLYEGRLKSPTLFVDDIVYKTPTSDEFNRIMQNLHLKG